MQNLPEPHLKILILSPHRDDAAFSLSIAMHNWLVARHTVTLLNVFTRSRHAPFSDAAFVHENDELSYVSAMRLREDELFVRRMTQDLPKGSKSNLRMVDLNLKDAPIRLRCDADAVCSTPVNPADPAIEKIRKALDGQRNGGAMDAIVVPAGSGSDVDHLTVREAALPFTSARPSAFYEELPYAATRPGEAADRSVPDDSAVAGGLSPALCRADSFFESKRKLVLGYASQVDAGIVDAMIASHGGCERLWGNRLWSEIAEAERLSAPQ